MKTVERDDTKVEISCLICGNRFTKRADEGTSCCYDCYRNINHMVIDMFAELKTKYGAFEFAEHISKSKQDVFMHWFSDCANKIHAIGYQHGIEDKIKECPVRKGVV